MYITTSQILLTKNLDEKIIVSSIISDEVNIDENMY